MNRSLLFLIFGGTAAFMQDLDPWERDPKPSG